MAKRTPGLRKRGKVWHFDKVVFGIQISGSSGTGDLGEAEGLLAKKVEAIRSVEVQGHRPRVTFSDAAARYLQEKASNRAIRRSIQGLDQVMPYIGSLEVSKVHIGTLEAFIQDRLEAGRSPGTINRDLACVRQVLNRAARLWRHDNGQPWLDTAPLIEMLPHESRRAYVLTLQEQQAIFSHLPVDLACAALFAVNTGLRRSEVLALKWEWKVQTHPAFIIPGSHHKNKHSRLAVCNSVALRVLQGRSAKHPVFVFSRKDAPISWTVLKYHWVKAREAAGLPKVRFHDLRHSFGSRLRAAGVGFEDRQDLLGHKSRQVTTDYCAADIYRLLDAVEKVVNMETETALRLVKSDKSPTTEFQLKEESA